MERPSSEQRPDTPEFEPFLVSREYEDYLDWLENQRRDRTRRNLRGLLVGLTSAVVTAFTLAGTMLRRR